MCVTLASWSQNLALEQEEDNDFIAVVGYFSKNDTMTYTKTYTKYKIMRGDTTESSTTREEFMIVVTDSTSNGYKMKYIPMGYSLSDEDTDGDNQGKLVEETLMKAVGSIVCEFSTDELGQVVRIDNWREIRDKVKKGVKLMCDTLYRLEPGIDSIMPRKQLENLMQLRFATEEGVRESYDDLNSLFGLHGNVFDEDEKEIDSDEEGYPMHIVARAGYTPVEDEENDYEGDYAIATLTSTIMPVEDLMDIGFGALSLLMSDMVSDSLDVMRDVIIDSLQIAAPQGVDIQENAYFGYFMNGWPKEYYYEKIVDLGLGKKVQTTSIVWSSRNWDIYIPEDEEDESAHHHI